MEKHSSEPELLFETKFAVFGGRLCSLSIWGSENIVNNMRTIKVTSQSDISLLLITQICLVKYEELVEKFKAIIVSRTHDPSILGIRIDTNPTILLHVDSVGVCANKTPLSIEFRKGSCEEINAHLLELFAKEKSLQLSLAVKCDEFQKKFESKKIECETLKMRCEYQEKEIELLRQINQSSHFTCEENDDFEENMQDKGNQSSEVLLHHVSSESSNTPTTSNSAIDVETIKKECAEKNKQNEMLVGVVQYMICQLCPKDKQKSIDVSNLEEMEAHLLDKHVDKEKKQCEACPSDRYQPNNIVQHMRIHTNSIYACQHCGKRGRKNYLRSHIRTHTGERPFICDTCSKTFTDSSTLRRHRLVHTGEKKFQCPVCGRAIARKDNVKVHIRSHGIDL